MDDPTVVAGPPERRSDAKYPWSQWLDGRAHELLKGRDFDCTVDTMRSFIRRRAKRAGLEVETWRLPDTVFGGAQAGGVGLQTRTPNSEPKQRRRGRAPKYPWPLWLDGNEHILTRGVDFNCKEDSFRQQAFTTARRKGSQISFHHLDDGRVWLKRIGPYTANPGSARDTSPLGEGDGPF